jgi:hypothetical protein
MSQSYGGVGQIKFSKSVGSLDLDMSKPPIQLMSLAQVAILQQKSYACYSAVIVNYLSIQSVPYK